MDKLEIGDSENSDEYDFREERPPPEPPQDLNEGTFLELLEGYQPIDTHRIKFLRLPAVLRTIRLMNIYKKSQRHKREPIG